MIFPKGEMNSGEYIPRREHRRIYLALGTNREGDKTEWDKNALYFPRNNTHARLLSF